MPISFQCECGKSFAVAVEHAGKRTKCPTCGAALTVPQPAVELEDEALRLLNEAPDPDPVPAPQPRPSEYRPPAAPPPPPPRPTKRQKQMRRGTTEERRERPRIVLSAGVLGGLLAMVVGAIWFFVGLADDRIFLYPPIMFFFGLVAVVKGLLGHAEE